MTTWTLREYALLGVLTELGHAVTPDNQKGWAKCSRCETSWWVRKRAELADLGGIINLVEQEISSQPMDMKPCSAPTKDVSPT
jgi:hypothetical protein